MTAAGTTRVINAILVGNRSGQGLARERSKPLGMLETFDPGWHAFIDEQPARTTPGDDWFLAMPVPAGEHHVRLEFRTPGAPLGIGISIASVLLLLIWTALPRRERTRSFSLANPEKALPPRRL